MCMCLRKHHPVQENLQVLEISLIPPPSVILEAIILQISDTVNELFQASALKRKSPCDSIVQTGVRTINLVQFTTEETGREGLRQVSLQINS